MPKKSNYFEPNAHIKKQESVTNNRIITIRFESDKDIKDFVSKTGIHINTETKTYKFKHKKNNLKTLFK